MVENLSYDVRVFNDRDDPHRTAALWAGERVHLVDLESEWSRRMEPTSSGARLEGDSPRSRPPRGLKVPAPVCHPLSRSKRISFLNIHADAQVDFCAMMFERREYI
jgi:hypothetical protein